MPKVPNHKCPYATPKGGFLLYQPPCANSENWRLCSVFMRDLDLMNLLGMVGLR